MVVNHSAEVSEELIYYFPMRLPSSDGLINCVYDATSTSILLDETPIAATKWGYKKRNSPGMQRRLYTKITPLYYY